MLRTEKVICTKCLHQLPVTNYHLQPDNEVKKIFYARVQMEHATSLLLFETGGLVQEVIHNHKYRGQDGSFLGTWLGMELRQIPAYQNIDCAAPAPIHQSRVQERGYDQVEKFDRNIAASLKVPCIDAVLEKKEAPAPKP